MSLMINQNITALNAWRNLNKTDRSMGGTMEKLSSGLRINKAADDPSGLVISEQMRAQVVGLKAAIKNSEKGVSMIQTAEAALDKMHTLLDKMRALALDSANSATSDETMLAANQAEIDNILATITRIGDYTQYGTKPLFDGSTAGGGAVGGAGTAVASGAGATSAGVYQVTVTGTTATLQVSTDGGTTFSTAGTSVTVADNGTYTLADADGQTLDVTFGTLADGVNTVTVTPDSFLTFQVGPNQNQTVSIAIPAMAANRLATGLTTTSGFASLAEVDVTSTQGAQDTITLVDAAIDTVSQVRGELGAFQANTLEANMDSLRVAAENLQASESVIRDTDMAAEMAEFTKYQIMMQAGTAMLAQANMIPQNLLQLLQG